MVLFSAILGKIQGSQAKNRFLVPLEVIWLKILFSKNFLELSQMAKNMFFSWLHENVVIIPLWGAGAQWSEIGCKKNSQKNGII